LAGLSDWDAGGRAAARCAVASRISGEETIEIAKGYRIPGAVYFDAGISWRHSAGEGDQAGESEDQDCICRTARDRAAGKSLRDCPEIDFICRKEFDYSVVDYAKGKPLAEIPGVSFLQDGKVVHNPDAPQIQDLDALPHVTEVYKRDLDVKNYNVPFLLHPYVALYTTRGCPAQCTFCLWPQTLSGHPWRKRSTDDVAAEMAKAKQLLAGREGIFLRR
jgi:hypothetical protein